MYAFVKNFAVSFPVIFVIGGEFHVFKIGLILSICVGECFFYFSLFYYFKIHEKDIQSYVLATK